MEKITFLFKNYPTNLWLPKFWLLCVNCLASLLEAREDALPTHWKLNNLPKKWMIIGYLLYDVNCLLFSLFSLGAVDELGDMPYYAEHCAAMLAVTYSSGQGMQRNIVRAIYIREVPHMLCGTKLVSNKMPSRNLRWSDHLDLWIKFGFMYWVDNKMAAVMWFKRWSFVVDGEIFEFDPLKIDIILRTEQRRSVTSGYHGSNISGSQQPLDQFKFLGNCPSTPPLN